MPKLQIMRPTHKLWPVFYGRLLGPEGCNFHQEQRGENFVMAYNCNHDYTKARAILGTMSNIDIEASLKYFKKHGGICDCKIIKNV